MSVQKEGRISDTLAVSSETLEEEARALTDELPSGQLLAGRYRVESKLGEGGMGVVYLATHVGLDKPVAVKVLARRFADEPSLAQRFLQEARAASSVRNEHIVDVTDIGHTPAGAVFFVMEYLRGSSIGQLVRSQGAFSAERTRDVGLQICRALEATHARGIIHRDLKSDNIILAERDGRGDDYAKILDFGVAKVTENDRAGQRLTRDGTLVGTPEYMAPEQIAGDHADHRVDIYSLGCILYEMLTGTLPFDAVTTVGLLNAHLFDAPERPGLRAPSLRVPPLLETIVMRALEKDPARRQPSMRALHDELAQWSPPLTALAAPSTSGSTGEPVEAGSTAARVEVARAATERGDWQGALKVAETIVGRTGVRSVELKPHASLLERIYERVCAPLERRARVADASAAHDARAAFLLSRVDGTLTLDDLIEVSAMPRLEALRLLGLLLGAGAIVAD